METSIARSSSMLITATRAALALLLVAVIIGQVTAVTTGQGAADTYPEFSHLQAPLTIAAVVVGLCAEAVFVITGILAGYTQDGRIFGARALRLVDLMIGALALATILVTSALFLIPGPPVLGLLVLGGGLIGASFTLVLLVLRALLHRAAFMRVELDEVI